MHDENKTVSAHTIPHGSNINIAEMLTINRQITGLCGHHWKSPLSSDTTDHFNKMYLPKCENFVVDIRCPIILIFFVTGFTRVFYDFFWSYFYVLSSLFPSELFIVVVEHSTIRCDLALINRARGLHGIILSEVVSTDRTQWCLYTRPRSRFSHTDRLCSVKKIFIIWWKQEQFNSFNVTRLY